MSGFYPQMRCTLSGDGYVQRERESKMVYTKATPIPYIIHICMYVLSLTGTYLLYSPSKFKFF